MEEEASEGKEVSLGKGGGVGVEEEASEGKEVSWGKGDGRSCSDVSYTYFILYIIYCCG